MIAALAVAAIVTIQPIEAHAMTAEGVTFEDEATATEEKEDVCYIAQEEERKAKERIAAYEAAVGDYNAKLAEYYNESDIVMLAQLIDIEAGSVWPLCRRAAVGWTVCNRIDNGRWGPTSISGIITQPGQYAYYSGRGYSDLNYRIAEDVLRRWADEKVTGEENPGRTLPAGFDCFYGDGDQNHFYGPDGTWDYSFPGFDPYENWQ